MISIIVPVYNAEDFLEEAILSVFSQSYKDWELILVDDGSTDTSSIICDKAAMQSNKVRVVHKTNGGLSSARNAGIRIASGCYFTFLDADDILPRNSLLLMEQAAHDSEADVVCGRMSKFSSTEQLKKEVDIEEEKVYTHVTEVYSSEEAVEEILYQGKLDNSAWAKLYSRKLWENNSFRENTWYEDLDVFYHIFEEANKIVSIDGLVYFYRQHSASYLHNFNLRRADVLTVTERLTAYMSKHNRRMLPAAKSRQLSASFNILGLIAANGMDNDKEASNIADRCWVKIKELRREVLRNPHVRLKNKIGIMVSYLFGRKGVETLSKLVYRP